MAADSPFLALVSYWLEDMDLEDRLSRTTRLLYVRNMRTLVLPFFKDVTLRETGVARCDYFLKQLAKQSYNRARQARVVRRLGDLDPGTLGEDPIHAPGCAAVLHPCRNTAHGQQRP